MDRRFRNQIFSSFKSIGGYILAAIGTIVAVLSIKFQEELNVNYWIIITVIISIIVVITFFDVAHHFYKVSLNTSPQVLKVLKRNDEIILLTEFSDYLQVQGLVTIFWLNEDFEEMIGYGEVINIQNDKKIQISLTRYQEPKQSLEEIRKSILVKPFVTTKTIE